MERMPSPWAKVATCTSRADCFIGFPTRNAFDDTLPDNFAFDAFLTKLRAAEAGLSASSISPEFGEIGVLTEVTIRGSGFVSGMTATLEALHWDLRIVDSQTLVALTLPPQRWNRRSILSSPDGQT
jgi:hypothetical protein